MKTIRKILWIIRDLIFSAGFPPYKYLDPSGRRYARSYCLCKAVRKTTGRDAAGRHVVIGPLGEVFTFARSVSGRVSANNYDENLTKRITDRKI